MVLYLDVLVYKVSDHVGNLLIDRYSCYIIPVREVLKGVLDLLDGCLCTTTYADSHGEPVAAAVGLAK